MHILGLRLKPKEKKNLLAPFSPLSLGRPLPAAQSPAATDLCLNQIFHWEAQRPKSPGQKYNR